MWSAEPEAATEGPPPPKRTRTETAEDDAGKRGYFINLVLQTLYGT